MSRTPGQNGKSGRLLPLGASLQWRQVLRLGGTLLLVILGCDQPADSPLGPDPRFSSISLEDAKALLAAEKFDEAVDALRPFASVAEPESDVLAAYGRALLGASRQSLAVWPLQRLVSRPDPSEGARVLFVSALLHGGADLESVREASAILEERPNARGVRRLRSQGYEATLDIAGAVEDMEILVDESPDEARGVERLLNLLIKLEDWDGARERIAQLGELLERDGVSPQARAIFCATASRFEKERGDPVEAEAKLRGCLEESPRDPNLIFSLVEMMDQTERIAEATAYLEEVAKSMPLSPWVQQGLAGRYSRLDRHEDADRVLFETAQRINLPGPWLALGDMRIERGNSEGAADAVDRAVAAAVGVPADDPSLDWSRLTPESRFGLADVYIRARKYAPAERIIETFEDEPAMGLLLRARLSLDRGDPASALTDYQEAFVSFASNPAARYLAGRAAAEVGEFELAVEMYQDALRSDPLATDAGLVAGQMLMAEGRTNWAIDTLAFYLANNVDEPHAIRLMAQAAAASGRHAWAESVRAQLSNNLEWAGIALADQAKDITFLRDPEAAKEYLERSPSLEESTHFEAFSAWAGYSALLGKIDEARTRGRALTTKNPDSAGAWIAWSRILYEDGKQSEAIEAIRRAIELNPMIATASAELGKMLLAAGQLEEAIAAFDRADEIDPLDARAAISAAEGLVAAEDFEGAEARLRDILIRHPWHGRAAMMLVNVLQRDKTVVDEWTYQLARRAARYVGVSGPGAHLLLAGVELDRSNPAAAAASFRLSITAKHRVADAQYGLAKALVALDRPEEARQVLELALGSPDLTEPVTANALLDEINAKERDQ